MGLFVSENSEAVVSYVLVWGPKLIFGSIVTTAVELDVEEIPMCVMTYMLWCGSRNFDVGLL